MRIGLIGASVRAAAMGLADTSALAVGIDRFADQETRDVLGSRCLQARDWGHAVTLVRQMSRSPRIRTRRSSNGYWWLPTGGIELMPELLQALTWSGGRLLGCSLEAIRFAKSAQQWAKGMKSVCPTVPDFQLDRVGPGRWHRKRNWADQGEAFFWQRHTEGQLCSALYLINRGTSQLLATTRLWVNPSRSSVEPYGYLGNDLRTHLGKREASQLEDIGQWLAQQAGFRGLVGLDYFENGNVCPIEINPRCTASVELVEVTRRQRLWFRHASAVVQSCLENDSDDELVTAVERDPFMKQLAEEPLEPLDSALSLSGSGAKRIVYNRGETGQVTADWLEQIDATARPFCQKQSMSVAILDRPQPGTIVRGGEPIVTLLISEDAAGPALPSPSSLQDVWSLGEALERVLPGLPTATTSSVVTG